MTTVTTVPFSKLTATDAINARAATKDGLDELATSIAAKGLIQPLCVRPADASDKYEVIDGRRRYAALAKLVKDKAASGFTKNTEIPVLVRNEDDTEALETSLMANTVRLPMHAVDQFGVFARLSEQGKSDADIASRFGISEKTVRQHKALGRLAPAIREAWKKGKIDADVAKAFTTHPDHEVQAAAYERLKKQGTYALSDHSVRRELAGGRLPVNDGEVQFVGLDAYLAAGGTVTESLFEEENYIDDAALLKKLVHDKLEAECASLRADGWSWVAIADDLPGRWPDFWQDWPRVKGEVWDEPEVYAAADYTPEERARSGVVVSLSYEGELEIDAGIVRPAADGQRDIEDAIGDGDDEFDDGAPDVDDDLSPGEDTDVAGEETDDASAGRFEISGVLSDSLHQALTFAAARVVSTTPDLALRVLLATLDCEYDAPLKVHVSGHAAAHDAVPEQALTDRSDRFAASLASAQPMPIDALCAAVAPHLARGLNMVPAQMIHGSQSNRPENIYALRDALPAEAYLAAARESFNCEDYFKRASKAVALDAIEEMEEAGITGPIPDTMMDAKKADLAAFATRHATACGWLPPELRHPAYALTPAAQKEAAE